MNFIRRVCLLACLILAMCCACPDALMCDTTEKNTKKDYVYFNNLGENLYKEKKYKEAIAKYNKSLLQNPTSKVVLVNRGNALIGIKDYKNAYKDFYRALKVSSSFPPAIYGMALTMFYQKTYTHAYMFFSRLIRAAPNFSGAKKDINTVIEKLNPAFRDGVSEYVAGHYQDSLLAMQKLLLSEPSDDIIRYYSAASFIKVGLPQKALTLFGGRKVDGVLYPEIAFTLGKAELTQGNYAKADKYFSLIPKEAVLSSRQTKEFYSIKKRLPMLTKGAFKNAKQAFLEQKFKEALRLLKELPESYLNIPETHYYIGESYLREEEFNKAIKAFQKASELVPDSKKYLFCIARALYFSGEIQTAKVILKELEKTANYYLHAKKLVKKITGTEEVEHFFNRVKSSATVEERGIIVESNSQKLSKEIASYAKDFLGFIDNKLHIKASGMSRQVSCRIKLSDRDRFILLKKVLGKKVEFENVIHVGNSKKSFIVTYKPDDDTAFFWRNLNHALLHYYVESRVKNPPTWILEGLGTYFEMAEKGPTDSFRVPPNTNRMTALKMMYLAQNFYPLGSKSLLASTDFSQNPQVYYQEAYALCLYLIETDKMPNLLSELKMYAGITENTYAITKVLTEKNVSGAKLGYRLLDKELKAFVESKELDNNLKNGLIFYRQRNWDKAEAEFKSSLANNVFLTENIFYLGLTEFKRKNNTKALAYLEKYMSVEADRTSPLIFLSVISQMQRRDKTSKKYLLKAEFFEPSNPMVIAMKEKLRQETEKSAKKKGKLAKEHIKNSSKILGKKQYKTLSFYSLPGERNRDARAANNTGVFLFNSALYGKAAEKFKEAISIKKDFTEAQYNLGLSYFYNNNNEMAINSLLKGLKLESKNQARFYLYLSRAYSKINKEKKAKEYAKKYKLSIAKQSQSTH